MKKLTAEDLMSLKYGDKVWRFFDGECEGFRFVAIMPSNKRYLIFEHGEKLIHLYVADRGVFKGDWYGGEYDSKFVGLEKSKRNSSTELSVTRQRRISMECHPDLLLEEMFADTNFMASLKDLDSYSDDGDDIYDFLLSLDETPGQR